MRFVCAAMLVAAFVGLEGCSSNSVESQVAAMNRTNIQRVANLYGAYASMHNWEGPKDESELKSFVQGAGLSPKSLEMMSVDRNKLDPLFVSERDKKPIKIRYSVSIGRGGVAAVAFEQEGLSGKRMVAFTDGTVEEAEDARFNALWEGQGNKQMKRP